MHRLIATTDFNSAGGGSEPRLTADDCVPMQGGDSDLICHLWLDVRDAGRRSGLERQHNSHLAACV